MENSPRTPIWREGRIEEVIDLTTEEGPSPNIIGTPEVGEAMDWEFSPPAPVQDPYDMLQGGEIPFEVPDAPARAERPDHNALQRLLVERNVSIYCLRCGASCLFGVCGCNYLIAIVNDSQESYIYI